VTLSNGVFSVLRGRRYSAQPALSPGEASVGAVAVKAVATACRGAAGDFASSPIAAVVPTWPKFVAYACVSAEKGQCGMQSQYSKP